MSNAPYRRASDPCVPVVLGGSALPVHHDEHLRPSSGRLQGASYHTLTGRSRSGTYPLNSKDPDVPGTMKRCAGSGAGGSAGGGGVVVGAGAVVVGRAAVVVGLDVDVVPARSPALACTTTSSGASPLSRLANRRVCRFGPAMSSASGECSSARLTAPPCSTVAAMASVMSMSTHSSWTSSPECPISRPARGRLRKVARFSRHRSFTRWTATPRSASVSAWRRSVTEAIGVAPCSFRRKRISASR